MIMSMCIKQRKRNACRTHGKFTTWPVWEMNDNQKPTVTSCNLFGKNILPGNFYVYHAFCRSAL